MDINEFDPRRKIRGTLSLLALASFFAPWGLVSEHPRSPTSWLGAVGLWVLSIVLTVSVVSDDVPWAWLPPREGGVDESETSQATRREPLLEVRIRPRARANLPCLYGVFGLTASAIVHFGTYVGHGLNPDHPLFWALHIGIFPLFLALLWRLRVWQSVRRGFLGLKQRQLRWRELLRYFPPWVPPLVMLLFAYVLANFFFSVAQLPPSGSDTALTDAQAMYTARAFSGHWLIFYTIPTLFFAFVPSDARPPDDDADSASD
jgi:hypothetical protein